MVLDDAWMIDHADAFSVTAPPVCLLITTRNSEALVGLGAKEHLVNVLSHVQARQMLAEWTAKKILTVCHPKQPRWRRNAANCRWLWR